MIVAVLIVCCLLILLLYLRPWQQAGCGLSHGVLHTGTHKFKKGSMCLFPEPPSSLVSLQGMSWSSFFVFLDKLHAVVQAGLELWTHWDCRQTILPKTLFNFLKISFLTAPVFSVPHPHPGLYHRRCKQIPFYFQCARWCHSCCGLSCWPVRQTLALQLALEAHAWPGQPGPVMAGQDDLQVRSLPWFLAFSQNSQVLV